MREPRGFVRPPRGGRRGRHKLAYSALRRLAGSGRFRPWLDFTVCELFQAKAEELRQASRVPRAYTARLADEDDAAELGRFFGCPMRVEQRFGRGDTCAVVLADGRVCAGAWLMPGPADVEEDWDELRCLYRIPADVAWGYDGRGTKPGAWGSLMARLPEFLAGLGAQRIAASIHFNNHLSIDSHRSLGYRSVGWVGCVRMLGLTVRRYRPLGGGWRRLPGTMGAIEVLTRK